MTKYFGRVNAERRNRMTWDEANEYVDSVREHGTHPEIRIAVNWYRRVHGERALGVARQAYIIGKWEIGDLFMARMKLNKLTSRKAITESHERDPW